MPHPLQLLLLGDFRLLRDGQQVGTVNTPRQQSLLAYLALRRRAPQPRAHVASLFWPDSSEKQGLTNLRHLLHDLRKAVPQLDDLISGDARSLAWNPQATAGLDVAELERALAEADRAPDDARARSALAHAAALYGGPLLPECRDAWIEPERERLHREAARALRRLAGALEAAGDYAGALQQASRLLAIEPLHEASYELSMRLHMLAGDRAAALQSYESCERVLGRELGLSPGPALRELRERARAAAPLGERAAAPSTTRAVSEPTLHGRRRQWRQLCAAWQDAAGGRAQSIVILGEAGIGKSRLAEELCAWVERQGASVSRTRSYAAEGRLAFAPVAEWLRSPALRARLSQLEPIWRSEVSRILPELQVRRTAASEDPAAPRSWQRHRLLEGLSRAVLLARQPLLLLLDDMQWTDHETLEWLRYLLRFAPRAGLLVLGTIRTEELGSDHPLQRFLLDLGRDGQIGEVQLGPLTADDAALVAADVAGRPLSSAQAAQLYRETEGNPLFVVESMRAGEPAPATAEAALAAGAPGAGVTHLPPKVHAVIKTRLSQLSAAAAELAGVAAVLGRAFSFELLAAVSAGPEAALVHALDELWQRRILHETGRGTYDFTHDKLREVAYAQVHAPRRHVLHRRAAEALERMSVSDASSAWPQIAAHLEAAGLPLPALDAYQRAAEAAKRLHANEEAIRLFGRALALLLTTPRSRARLERQLELTRALGVCLVAARGYPDPSVWGVYESAGELCRQLGRPTEPPILRALAIASLTSGDLRRAEALGHELLSLATHADDAVVRVEGHYVLGVSYFWLGRFAESRTQLEASLACHDRRQREVHVSLYAQDPEAVCLCRLAMALYYLGDPEAAWARLDEARLLIRELEHPHTQAYVLCFGALLCVDMRESRRAAELLDALQVLTEAHPLDFWALRGEILRCIQRAADGGNVGEIDQAKRHMAAYARVGDRANASQFLGLQAQAHLARGEIDAGLAALDDAFAVLERIDERYFVAELHRLRGELLLAGGAELARAEACFARALELARAQGACSWELRAATSLGRLWQRRGLEQRVRELLEPLCARYGRSAQTPDLRDARALLDPPSAS